MTISPTIRSILATVIGLIVGNVVNGLLIQYSGNIIPLPEGVNPNSMEDLKAAMPTLPIKNFIMPFLAHALGTLSAALVACKLTFAHHHRIAIVVGLVFLVGGIAAAIVIGGPIWFIVLDLVCAYLPMAFLGKRLAGH